MFGSTISKFLKLDNLIEHLTGFVETKVEILKVEVKQDIASGLSKAISYLIIAFVFSMVLLFASLGLAVVLSAKLGLFWGYGIVGAVYLIVGIVLLAVREKMNTKFETELKKSLNKKK